MAPLSCPAIERTLEQEDQSGSCTCGDRFEKGIPPFTREDVKRQVATELAPATDRGAVDTLAAHPRIDNHAPLFAAL
jgi:hypothetical protein